MANREIKTTLKLEGEQQFKQAMRGASDAIKVLNSEQKLAEAQFQATGDKEQFMADKADILRRKIEEQQKAVNAAQEAVNKLKEQGVDPTNKAMQDWTTKLNTAKAYLTQLQGQLNSTESELEGQGDAFDDASAAAADYNDELQNIGKGIDFQNVTAILDSMHQRLEKALEMVTSVSTAIYNAVTDAGKWADDIAAEASKAGIDVETYQSWMYASQLIDTEVNVIISARQRLLKAMTSDNKETVKLFNKLGVVTRETNGDLRDQTDVFWDVIDALGRVEDPTMRDYYAQELLGKSARELNPLIEAGSQAYKDLAKEGREVAVVSGENVEKLGKLNDAQNKLNSELSKLKTDTLAGTAPAFTEATEKAGALVEAFNKFAETDKGRQAIEKLNTAIDALFDVLLNNIDPETVINVATEAIERLTSALEWITENGWTIVAILAGMKGLMATMTVAKGFLEVLQLMKSINWLNMSKGAKSLGDALGKGASETAKEAAAAGGGSLMKTVGSALPTAAILSAYAATVTAPVWGTQLAEQRDFGGYMAERQRYEETLAVQGDASIMRMQRMYQALAEMAEAGGALTDEDVKKIIAYRRELEEITGTDYGAMLDDIVPYFNENGLDAMTEYDFEKALGQMIADLGETIRESGQAIPEGMAQGIEENASTASDAAAGMARGIQDAVKETLGINSPSVVMFEDGVNVVQGLADGINARADAAVLAAANLAARVNAALAGAGGYDLGGYAMSGALYSTPVYAAGRAYQGGGQGGTTHVTLVMDKKIVGEATAPTVDATLGANYVWR